MTQTIIDKNAEDLIYLVSCAVNSEKPDPNRCSAMDLQSIYRLANRHMLTSAAAHALQSVTELPRPYDQAMKKAIRKIALFDIERSKIFAALDAEGIRYLPLKGIILKDLYPRTAMREMSDNDILCDPDRMEDVRITMESLGYTCENYGKFHHDSYIKPPTLEFEMHHMLIDEDALPHFAAYFADIRDRLLPDGCSTCGYRMSEEDFYLFLLAHMYKHYHFSGTGLRSLLDVYLYTRRYDDSLDKAYLQRELKKLELTAFEEDTRLLAQRTFTGLPLDEAQQKELCFYINSGSYGTEDQGKALWTAHALNGDDSKKAKRRYLLRRVFVSGESLQKRHPFVYRHKSLYPLLLVYRPIKGAVTRPREIIREYKNVKAYKKTKDLGSHND